MDKKINILTDKYTNKQTDLQMDIQTDGQEDKYSQEQMGKIKKQAGKKIVAKKFYEMGH